MAGWGYYDGYGGWPAYVPVAKKIANAKKAAEKLRKKGVDIQPVALSGRKIASSFWGKGWCDHMDSFHDYENRLPRGRSYVRNGSVVHLDVSKGKITAMVAGSKVYKVEVTVKLLPEAQWERIKAQCAGQISSLMDLLQGKLSDGVMRIVADRDNGLFPGPKEITMRCSCPDSAGMCKHIAAVFYGVGARLDTRPELLFLLRGVDHTELASQGGVDAVIDRGRGAKSELAGADLSEMFGIELVDGGAETPSIPASKKSASSKSKTAAKAKTPAKPARKRQTKKAAAKLDSPGASTSRPVSPKKTKAPPKPAARRQPKAVAKNDEMRLDKAIRLAREYAAEKKERKQGKATGKKAGKVTSYL